MSKMDMNKLMQQAQQMQEQMARMQEEAATEVVEASAGGGMGTVKANSEVRQNSTYGILSLTLRRRAYDFRFVPEAGAGFTDSGRGTCHAGPPGGAHVGTGTGTATRTLSPSASRGSGDRCRASSSRQAPARRTS